MPITPGRPGVPRADGSSRPSVLSAQQGWEQAHFPAAAPVVQPAEELALWS